MSKSHTFLLPSDPGEAVAGAIAVINGESSFNRAAGAQALRDRVQLLRDPTSQVAQDELAAHLPVLEALFLRFAGEAARADRPEHMAILLKLSLSAHAAYGRTCALLATLLHMPRGSKLLGVDVRQDDS